MVSLDQLKDYMKKRAEEDREVKAVHQTADTLEEALKNAALELGLPLKKIEYEILQKGAPGFLNMGKKSWSIIAYKAVKKTASGSSEETPDLLSLGDLDRVPVQTDVPGKAFVRLYHDGAYLKVTKPVGSGEPVSEEMALEMLHARQVRDINKNAVKGTVKLAMGTYAKVGEFIHNPGADTIMSCDLEDGEMAATLTLTPPGSGGADISREEIEHFLRNNGVVHGVLGEYLDQIVDEPQYGSRLTVAEGTKPNPGKDARIVYFFDTSLKVKPQEFEDGRVDFKNLNNIHNVIKGEELARKEIAERGVPGRTVTGRQIPTRDGRDVNFELGNNVSLSKDGLKVLATADGQVLLQKNVLSVETVMIIPGDVNPSVGNINSFGSVIVKGNVEDGFTVKANGNIEVLGNVGKSFLETPGDIIVHQGINGNFGGMVSAGQNLWSRFIQNASVTAGSYVICSDGILHSTIVAGKKILCRGKRAKIVGGHLKATEEINANSLGAPGADETVLEVGVDPKVKEELDTMVTEKESMEKQLSEANLNMQGMLKQQRIVGKLAPDKETKLKELKAKAARLQTELPALIERLEKRQAEVEALRALGKVSAGGQVFPGTKIVIRDITFDVVRDYQAVTFVREGNLIRPVKYVDIEEEEIVKRM